MMAASPQRLEDLVGADRATIPQLFAARCARTPDRPFVLADGRRWSYGQAWDEARRFAGFLQRRFGALPRVAVYMGKRPEALWAWFGTLLAGGTFVAINRAHRGPVLADQLARSGARVLVTDAPAADLPPDAVADFALVLSVETAAEGDGPPAALSWGEIAAAAPGTVREAGPADPACLLFSSGTTGRSKAVLLPHNMYCRGAAYLADAFGFDENDIYHDWMPLAHIGGQLHATMSAVVAGACLALVPAFSRGRFWSEVRETGATAFFGFATVIKMLLLAPERPDDSGTTLRVGLIGALPGDIKAAFERRFGVRLLDTYGMSEAEPLTLPSPDTPPGSCGRPAPDFELAILDEADRRLPLGEVGRIAVRPRVPDVMMQRYEGDDAATVEAWRNLWFHTQDLGRIDADGFVFFVDRLKHAIRRGGENVAAAEVERALLAHATVQDCAVVGVPDPLFGQAVKAVVVPQPNRTPEPAELHAYCRGAMARFMVPRYFEMREALPYTDVGKVRRDALGGLGPGVWDAEAERPADPTQAAAGLPTTPSPTRED